MRRVVSLWLPWWQTDLAGRSRRSGPGARRAGAAPAEPACGPKPSADGPLVLTAPAAGTERLAAVSPAAARAGLAPGMTLADARALVPDLRAAAAEPMRAARALEALAEWALRFTPWAATSGADGLMLDVSGCAHLFGGEDALLARLVAGVEGQGVAARAALADTPGAAWACARFEAGGVVPAGGTDAALAPLPVAALRLEAATAAGLERVGLRRIGDLLDKPRAPLAARFGEALIGRLDQARGRVHEPVSPRRPPARHQVRRAFAEPVADMPSILAALDSLTEELCAGLARAGLGARRLALILFRIDGGARTIPVGTSRPVRAAAALMRLFAEHLDGFDAGAGIEVIALAARTTEPAGARQLDLARAGDDGAALGHLVDRIANRLGAGRVKRLGPRPSHLPDRAVSPRPAVGEGAAGWPARPPRPVRLLTPPLPVDAVAVVPDGPPVLFRWRGRVHRVARASGPERIADEWWHEAAPTRDYYRVEDTAGARFWLYREGLYEDAAAAAPRWYLHGLFG
jgi:protein ImuB